MDHYGPAGPTWYAAHEAQDLATGWPGNLMALIIINAPGTEDLSYFQRNFDLHSSQPDSDAVTRINVTRPLTNPASSAA